MDSDTKAHTSVDPWDAALLGGSVAQTAASMYMAAPQASPTPAVDVAVPFPPPPPPPLPQSAVIPTVEQREKMGIPRDVVAPVAPATASPAIPSMVPPAPAPAAPSVRTPDFTKLSIKPTPLMQTRPVASVPPPMRPLVMPRVPPSPASSEAAPVPPRPVVAPIPMPAVQPRPQVTVPPPPPLHIMSTSPAEQRAVVDAHVPIMTPSSPAQLPSIEISPALMKTAAAVLAIPLFGFGFLFADVAKNVVAKIQKGASVASIISSLR